MEYHLIIFDLDGVICHTDEYHYQAWKALADQENIYFDRQINERLRGVSRMESLDIILEKAKRAYTEEEKQALATAKNGIYVKLLNQMDPDSVSPDTVNTLKILRERGLSLAIGSSSKNARLILHRIGLTDYFDVIADGTMIRYSKPHPEVFLKAAELLGSKPCESLVVEDAVAGIEAAYRGGFCSAAIGDAQNHPKATYKIETISGLLNII